jgi:hypothetical protein
VYDEGAGAPGAATEPFVTTPEAPQTNESPDKAEVGTIGSCPSPVLVASP